MVKEEIKSLNVILEKVQESLKHAPEGKYHRNGIYEGDKLLLTYETKNSIIDMKDLGNIIERYLR